MLNTRIKLLLVAGLILVSCGKNISNSGLIPPTQSITPSVVVRPTQAISPTPYKSPTPTEFQPYGVQLTPLPQPQIAGTVVNLFETNGGCRLPCWWGITPGQTTWEQAFQILEPLVDRASFTSDTINVNIPVRGAFSPPYLIYRFTINDKQVITMITTNPPEPYPFWLTDMVDQYGLPDEIILHGWYPLADGVTGYSALYQELGFMVVYNAKINVKGVELEVCPYADQGKAIASWDLGSHSYLDFFSDLDINLDLHFNVFLSEVTSLSVSDFLDLYQQPNGCFDTPGSMWLEFDYVSP